MINVGIVGGTGYTGVELLRILAHHPEVAINAVTSRSDSGVAVSELYPNLRGAVDREFCEPDLKILLESACDVVFFATPNGTAMGMAPMLLDAGITVIDLSADFRLKDPAVWEKWYGDPHPSTGDVKGSNRCQIAVHRPENSKVIVVLSVIDNLIKGAVGQAVQCMNLSFGFDESLGLSSTGLYP